MVQLVGLSRRCSTSGARPLCHSCTIAVETQFQFHSKKLSLAAIDLFLYARSLNSGIFNADNQSTEDRIIATLSISHSCFSLSSEFAKCRRKTLVFANVIQRHNCIVNSCELTIQVFEFPSCSMSFFTSPKILR